MVKEREMSDWTKHEKAASDKVKAAMDKGLPPDRDEIYSSQFFDPWRDVIGCMYGDYNSEFDDCALGVLRDLRDQRTAWILDLSSEMFREVLCNLSLCSYGTSPRSCFPTESFAELLPSLIDMWQARSEMLWCDSEGETHDTD